MRQRDVWLFDVNALIAIADPGHLFHESIHRWLGSHDAGAWATCPITENGFVRILAQPQYRGGPSTPGEAIETLERMKSSPGRKHVFWPDSISLCERTLIHPNRIAGSKQVTDAYLAALALRNRGKLVTFDTGIAWQAVAGATAELIVHPAA